MRKPGRDIPDDEIVYDSHGRPLTDEYINELVEDTMTRFERRGGRPPLAPSEPGPSPTIRVRASRELTKAVDAAAANCHMSRSEWVRQVLIATLGEDAPVVFQHNAVRAAS
jgi:hypothetical protein